MASQMSTPNEIVATRIAEALEAKKILLPDSAKGLVGKLSAGQLTSSDWVTLFGLDAKARKQNAKDETKKH
jgi:acetylglutamate kinase